MEEFMNNHNFSSESIDLIDRLTRLTDGAGIDRYTLNEFLQLFNQQILYQLYQPVLPNDEGLFKIWQKFLTDKGVEFMLNTTVESIGYDSGYATSVTVKNDSSTFEIYSNLIVLAIPPQSFLPILKKSSSEIQNSFMDINRLEKYSENTSYMTYISLTFHWDKALDLPSVYGFPKSEWGVAFIVLTDYMSFDQSSSITVITCTITITDFKSSFTGKTANETEDPEEIINEVLRQLKESFPDLETPTISLLTPEMSYNNNMRRWETTGNAFISSSVEDFFPFVGKIPNLFNVGTQNGKHLYKFTSMESAVTNAVYLSHMLRPRLKNVYKIKKFFTVVDLCLIIMIIIVFILIIIIYKSITKRKNGK
jgi:hypothetical protein